MSDAPDPLFEQPPPEPGEPNASSPPPDALAPYPYVVAVRREREPFWGYNELLLFLGLAPLCLGLGLLLVKAVIRLLHADPPPVEELLPAQLLFYVFLFGALAAIFRFWYDKPFWRSLGWREMRLPFLWVIICGMGTALTVALLSALIRLPDTDNEMTEMMQSTIGLVLMAIFGVTIAPLGEELVFRGFLQPLLVRSLGTAFGVILTAVPFGVLHFWEYGNSWRHALVIGGAGLAFGVMRQATGSTKASTLMHAAYNGLFFLSLLADRKDVPHPW